MREFVLQFPPAEIRQRSDAYPYGVEEAAAMEAGRKIAAGTFSLEVLEPIFVWKVKDRRPDLREGNTLTDVKEALMLATLAKNVRSSISVLASLDGVGIPVASAIMTAIRPSMYTVIDMRAIGALGLDDKIGSYGRLNYYMTYLRHCIEDAKTHGVTLREYDRALWQWHEENFGRRSKR